MMFRIANLTHLPYGMVRAGEDLQVHGERYKIQSMILWARKVFKKIGMVIKQKKNVIEVKLGSTLFWKRHIYENVDVISVY